MVGYPNTSVNEPVYSSFLRQKSGQAPSLGTFPLKIRDQVYVYVFERREVAPTLRDCFDW